ncbi:MAG: aminomethyl-transferring glycine dehydrogenase subunit GcvPA [Clostridiales bacterium]|nr:aminomethyl-transferring glycine dehydrogenase subunit GcvPA [Clostridiales bacterium]
MTGYIPHTNEDIQKMLDVIGVDDIDALFLNLPDAVKQKGRLNIPEGRSEIEVLDRLNELADKNTVYKTIFRGAGAYNHFIPSVVSSLASRSEFLTAYTPYQPEISQGILQAMFEYQTMICELTGLEVSNASVYDGANAAAEAAVMCMTRKRSDIAISDAVNPQIIAVLKSWSKASGAQIRIVPQVDYKTDMDAIAGIMGDDCAALIMQSPNYYGVVEDMQQASDITHDLGGYFVASVNPTSLMLFQAPGEYGADIAVGEGQPLGNPLAFGGPYLGFMAATEKMMRKLPGRIVGQSHDKEGRRGYVLTLQAREQHIRRERASSNVCSNQAHAALTATIYMAAMGKRGLYDVAKRCYDNAHYLKEQLCKIDGVSCNYHPFFHEFMTSGVDGKKLNQKLSDQGILGPFEVESSLLWCTTELNNKDDIDKVVSIAREVMT